MHLDEDEFLELEYYHMSEIQTMLDNKVLEDAKTIIALQYILLNYNHYK